MAVCSIEKRISRQVSECKPVEPSPARPTPAPPHTNASPHQRVPTPAPAAPNPSTHPVSSSWRSQDPEQACPEAESPNQATPAPRQLVPSTAPSARPHPPPTPPAVNHTNHTEPHQARPATSGTKPHKATPRTTHSKPTPPSQPTPAPAAPNPSTHPESSSWRSQDPGQSGLKAASRNQAAPKLLVNSIALPARSRTPGTNPLPSRAALDMMAILSGHPADAAVKRAFASRRAESSACPSPTETLVQERLWNLCAWRIWTSQASEC